MVGEMLGDPSLKNRASEMYSCKWIFVDVDRTPKKKMGQMYDLCKKLTNLHVHMIEIVKDLIL